MLCSNKECGMNIKSPLILFDGRWICPYCKTDLFPNEETEMKITNENHEKLLISEKLFNEKWLLNVLDEDKVVYLKQAIELCREAAFLNNPYALINLGYYYENGYVSSVNNRTEQLRMAYLYYNSVCFNQTAKIKMFGNAKEIDNKEVRIVAAKNLYNLLNEIPKDNNIYEYICGKTLTRGERLESIRKILIKYGIMPEANEETENKDSKINIDSLYAMFIGRHDQERTPLFGIFKLSKQEINELMSKGEKNSQGVEKKLSDNIGTSLKIKIGEASSKQNNEIVDSGLVDIQNAPSLEMYLNRCDDKSMFYLYFFNTASKSKYFKKKEIQKVNKVLSENKDENIIKLIFNGMYNRFVFSEDDIYKFCRKIIKIDDAINELQAYCSGI